MLNNQQKLEAIQLLEENRKNCKEFNFFGANNWKKIDTTISIFQASQQFEITEEWIDENIHDDYQQTAISAMECLNEEFPIQDMLYPVDEELTEEDENLLEELRGLFH